MVSIFGRYELPFKYLHKKHGEARRWRTKHARDDKPKARYFGISKLPIRYPNTILLATKRTSTKKKLPFLPWPYDYGHAHENTHPPPGLTRKALSVSCMLDSAGDTQQIMSVWLLPPSESCSMRVSFESLYGTCTLPLFVSSPSALITFPKVSSPLLMSTPWQIRTRGKAKATGVPFTALAVPTRGYPVPTRSPARPRNTCVRFTDKKKHSWCAPKLQRSTTPSPRAAWQRQR